MVVHIHGTETQFAIIYGVFAVSVLVVCIYGFKMMLFINKIAVVASTILSSVAALLTVNIPGHFVGWLGNLAGGIDVSLVIALILPALLYPACLFLFPEPRAIYGPDGPRVVPAPDLPLAPIRGSGESDSISSGIQTR